MSFRKPIHIGHSQGDFQHLEERLATITQSLNRMSELQRNAAGLERRLNHHNDYIANISSQMSSFETQQQTISSKQDELKQHMQTLQSTSQAQGSHIGNLVMQVANVEQQQQSILMKQTEIQQQLSTLIAQNRLA
jgi:chromosome segregation ATPase